MKLSQFPPDLRGIIKEVTLNREMPRSPIKEFNTVNSGSKEMLSSSSTLSPPRNMHHTVTDAEGSQRTKTTLSS